MGSDAAPANPPTEPTGPGNPQGDPAAAGGRPSLDALSDATDRYARSARESQRNRPRPSFALAGVAAIVVGGALALAGRSEYHCSATLRITGEPTPTRRAVLRGELASFAWELVADPANTTKSSAPTVHVDSPASDLLRINLIGHDREASLGHARRLAEDFLTRAQTLVETARTTPTEAEHVLSQYVAALQARIDEARTQVDAAIAALPQSDPSGTVQRLVTHWKILRSDFDTAKQQLGKASVDLANLQGTPLPTHGVVTGEERREAQAADKALQQDLEELRVHLTELKLQLLTVWQQSAGALDRLLLAADDLAATASSDPREQPPGQNDAPGEGSIGAGCDAYTETLRTFSEAWNREFTTLRQLGIDPLNGDVLDVYYRVQRRLSDFLFQAGKRLSSLRATVDALSADPRDTARHHVFQSDLVRAFHTLQAGHHRFEFAVDGIETPQNFRLDAAIKSARGLRRRSQERARAIEARLQDQALKRARNQRVDELTKAEALLTRVRSATDETVEQLVTLQEELNLTAGESEAFLRAVMKAEVASARLEVTREDLTATEGRLHQLASERVAGAGSVGLEIVSCDVVGHSLGLGRRISSGGLGAVLTLLAVLLTQWWITRRAWPSR